MQQALPHATKICDGLTKECRACLRRWESCQACKRAYLKTETGNTSCPACQEPRQTRYRYSAKEREVTQCPMCDEPRACINPVMKGRDKCRMHGGKSKKGAAHGKFKHGYRTADAPLYLLQHYEESLNDPEMQTLDHEVALARGLVKDGMARLARGESGEIWKQLQTSFGQLTGAIKANDAAKINQALTNLHLVIRQGVSDETARREIRNSLKLVSALKGRQSRIERDANLMIPIQQFYILMGQTLAVVERYVPKDEHGKLYDEFNSIMVAKPN